MKLYKIFFLLFFSLGIAIFGQRQKQKEALQKENAVLKKEIAQLNRELAQSQKKARLSIANLQNLNKKIALREELYRNSRKEKRLLEDEIYLKQLAINKHRRELAKLREDYAKVLVKAYKNKGIQNKVLFILSSDNLGQALRRVQYLKQYADYQDRKSQEIRNKTKEIEKTIAQRKKAMKDKEKLLERQREELATISKEREQKKALIEEFKKHEGEITAEITQKQTRSKQLESEIKRIIREEIRIAKEKAEKERKAREEAERRARIAAAKEKARIEAANKAKAEALAKQKAKAEAEAKRAEELAKRKAAAEKEQEAREAYEKARAARDRANEAERKAAQLEREEKQAKEAAEKEVMKNYGLTKVEGKNFADNRGNLPFPVPNGQITHRFGREHHPVFENIIIENSGIKIAVPAGTIARSVFYGVVSKILYDSTNQSKTVIVRHGTSYFTVYSNLTSVSVNQGQNVATGTPLGKVGIGIDGTYTLEFQVWHGQNPVNPLNWVSH